MRIQNIITGLVTFIAAALTLTACASSTTGASTAVSVNLSDFAFAPMTATVPAGKEITLNLKNTGKVLHEYVIIKAGEKVTLPFDDDDESKVYWESEVAAGETKTVTFTAPTEAGVYEVVCGQPTHIEAGMKGTLTVVK
jgi:uncharacterized cupredoxin-like copper-binding protein